MDINSAGWFVTAKDITHWTETNKRDSEGLLPLLVRKLILASSQPESIDFPSGDLVQVGGWDGTLNVETTKRFIPSGVSGWEFGTNKVVSKKVNQDYDKRTNNPGQISLKDSTFVFVTSRLWTKKKKWVEEKKKEKKWKDVRGINAEDLADWLAENPAVHRWFARIVGKRTAQLWDLEQAWEALSQVTSISLGTELFTNAREKEKKDLLSFLQEEASVFRVKAQSEREAYQQ